MQTKGVAFTVEAVYVIVIVFTALLVMVTSLHQVDLPNYDSIQAMKVVHDMGEAMTALPPVDTGGNPYYDVDTCPDEAAVLQYYSPQEVCMK